MDTWRLKDLAWVKYKLMLDIPEALAELTLETMTPQQWELLAERCYTGRDWYRLLLIRPDLADRCPLEKLEGGGGTLGWFLGEHPEFADNCEWSKLDGSDWRYLLQKRPQFADKCGWNKLNGYDWSCLLTKQPQFADKCDWDHLAFRDFRRIFDRDWESIWDNHPRFNYSPN